MDETSGTLADSSGYGNHGTISGSPVYAVSGRINAAMEFDGSSDHVDIPDPGADSIFDITPGDTFTIAAWIYPNALSNYGEIVVKGINSGSTLNYSFFNYNNQIAIGYRDASTNSQQYRSVANVLNTGEWIHVATTYTMSDASSARLYVNGELVSGSWAVGTGNEPPVAPNDHTVKIGGGTWSTDRFNGRIDDVRFYNRALDEDEAEALYKSGSLAAHWRLDETSGLIAVDSAGGNHGDLVGGALWEPGDSKLGGAINFPSSSARINIPDSPALSPSNITVALWAKPHLQQTQSLINKGELGPGWEMSMALNGGVIFRINRGHANEVDFRSTAYTYPSSGTEWAHYVGTYDGSTLRLYINGIQNHSTSTSVPIETNAFQATIGARNDGDYGFVGELDDIRIYNRALSAEEVALLYTITNGDTDPVTGCDTIGQTCNDGSIYAGQSPDGGVPMYTTPADAPSTMTWNNGTGNYVDTAMSDCTIPTPGNVAACETGSTNTAFLANLSDAGAPYQAALYCHNLNAHGRTDWYLPAQDELKVLYDHRDDIGNFVQSGSWPPAALYWSSSEQWTNPARVIDFSDGTFHSFDKDDGPHLVRCVRKGHEFSDVTFCSSPYGVAGQMFYNDDENLMQYCNGTHWVAMTATLPGAMPPSGPGSPSDPCENSPTPGTTCADGTIYVDTDANGALYTTANDEAGVYRWKTTNSTTSGTGSETDGAANTDAMEVSGLANHPAAQACRARGASWYLPSTDELYLLYDNRTAQDLNGSFTNTNYWSSTESDFLSDTYAWYQDFSAFPNIDEKTRTHAVRCVRR